PGAEERPGLPREQGARDLDLLEGEAGNLGRRRRLVHVQATHQPPADVHELTAVGRGLDLGPELLHRVIELAKGAAALFRLGEEVECLRDLVDVDERGHPVLRSTPRGCGPYATRVERASVDYCVGARMSSIGASGAAPPRSGRGGALLLPRTPPRVRPPHSFTVCQSRARTRPAIPS